MLQIESLAEKQVSESKKRQSGDWRSKAKAGVLPNRHSTLTSIPCQEEKAAKTVGGRKFVRLGVFV